MSLSYINSGAIISSASATGLTPVPGTNQAGDVVVAVVAVKNNATVSTPSGWTSITEVQTGSNFSVAYYYAINLTGLSSAAFTWTGAAAAASVIHNFRGANTSIPTGAVHATGGGGDPHTNPGFNSTYTASWAVSFDTQDSGTVQTTTPSGWTGNYATGDSTSAIAFAVWSKQLGASGSASGAISVSEGPAVLWINFQLEIAADQLMPQACL